MPYQPSTVLHFWSILPVLAMKPEVAIFGFIVLDTICGAWSVTYYGDRIVSFGMEQLFERHVGCIEKFPLYGLIMASLTLLPL